MIPISRDYDHFSKTTTTEKTLWYKNIYCHQFRIIIHGPNQSTQKKAALQPQNNQVATAQAFKWRGSTTTQFSKIVLKQELFRNAHIFYYMLPAIYLAG